MDYMKRINFYFTKANEYLDDFEVRNKFPNRLDRLVKYKEAFSAKYLKEREAKRLQYMKEHEIL
ncbi:hypothetical protein RAK27_11950 [Carnobacterium maltaromaticum]|uniref:Uncharacterized protein n=1 Tax=Carnobacterium maltaromaticum TaxID=2751 RepID=A0AAW9K7I2_CARML|nr:hypothetical protein [Carnobacterium maltaromaticum]MDZ5759377.1 hypothetical protein [Carnobacterium maltaromaticum]